MNSKFNIGDILIHKHNGEYYLIYDIEGAYTYVSLLSDSGYQNKYIAVDYYFTRVSKA